MSTGGGPATEITYTEWENILLRFLFKTSTMGLPNPESNVFESSIFFNNIKGLIWLKNSHEAPNWL